MSTLEELRFSSVVIYWTSALGSSAVLSLICYFVFFLLLGVGGGGAGTSVIYVGRTFMLLLAITIVLLDCACLCVLSHRMGKFAVDLRI